MNSNIAVSGWEKELPEKRHPEKPGQESADMKSSIGAD